MPNTIHNRILDWPVYLLLQRNAPLLTVLTSGLIFYGGYRDFVAKKFAAAKSWWIWAILILVFYSSTLFFQDRWLALVLVLGALVAELTLFAKFYFECEEQK